VHEQGEPGLPAAIEWPVTAHHSLNFFHLIYMVFSLYITDCDGQVIDIRTGRAGLDDAMVARQRADEISKA